MKRATSKAVLIAWDMGRGPTFKAGARRHPLYRVYRDGARIGDTCAEAFYDRHVRRGAVYTYRVFAVAPGGAETAVGPTFTVHVPSRRPRDRIPPTAPEKLTTKGWTPSSDSGSGVLAYFVERDNGSQPWAVLWNSGEDGPTSGKLHEWTDESAVKKPYRLRALDGALNLSKPSLMVAPEGAPFLWVDAFGPWTEHGGIRLRGLITLDKMEWDDEWVYGENRCTDLDLWNDEDAWPMWHVRDDTVRDWHYPNNQLSLLPAFIFYDGDDGRYRLKVKWERYRYGYGVYYWARSTTTFDFNVMPNVERTLTIVSSADGGLDDIGYRLVSIVTTADHDLYIGNTIVIDGHTSTPDINGWLDEDDVQQGAHIVSEVHSYPGWYWTSPPNLPPNLRRFEITLPDGDPFTGGAGGTVTVPYVPDGGKIYLGNFSNHWGDGFWMLPQRGPVMYDDNSQDEW